MRAAIRSAFRSGFRGAFRRAARVLNRFIRTWNGSNTYGALNDPINAVAGDTIEIVFSNVSSPDAYLIDGTISTTRAFVYTVSGLLTWDAASFSGGTLDGVAMSNGVTPIPTDGELHTTSMTAAGACILGVVGARYTFTNIFSGEILTVTHTPIATGIPLVYDMDDDSLTTTYAEGHASPSTKFITWSNFVASDIELFTYDAANTLWAGVEMHAAGPAWAFDGTEPAGTNIFADDSVIGNRYKYNFILSDYTTGSVQLRVGGIVISSYVAEANVSGLVTATGTAQRLKNDVDPTEASGTWSVKRVLEEV